MFNYTFILLQAANSSVGDLISGLLLGSFVLIIIFLIIRSVVLWYWKVNVIVRNQEEQTQLLSQIFEQAGRRDARINYYKAVANGDKQQAYDSMLHFVFHDLTVPGIKEEDRRAKYENLKTQYSAKFKELGYEFPQYPF